jgi:cell division transport system permease protein
VAGAAPTSNPIVPETTVSGRALTIVVAIMSFLASLTVGAVTLVGDASREWQEDIVREVTIQVRPIDGVDLDAAMAEAVRIARETPGVTAARPLAAEENAALVEPWLGSGLDIDALPLPRLIVVELGSPRAVDLAGLAARLSREVEGASLDDHRLWTDRLRTMAGATVIVGTAILALVFVATALSVVFATRGAMAGNRNVVSVLHFVGAEDRFIANEIQRHFMLLGLRGGLFGAGAAAILFAILSVVVGSSMATPEGDQVAALFGRFAIGPTGYFGALGIAFMIAVMTAVTSRLTVHRYLAEVE